MARPFLRQPRPSAAPAGHLNAGYDRLMFSDLVEDYYDQSDFCNWGYWLESTRTQREACENLMEKLLSFIPQKSGDILDVACGKGATTRYLLKFFPAERITGINISEAQLERARENVPGATFQLMDATEMRFPADHVDHVICVEAAFHFRTREQFLREAHRVLKPGGRLVLSDILFTRFAEEHGPGLDPHNWLPGPDSYRQLLASAGFRDVEVVDASEECWLRYEEHQARFVWNRLLSGEMDRRTFRYLKTRRSLRQMSTRYYLLAAGTKA